ncbi:hypothetical protein [Actinomadura madurae]|uniref:hypothetical protein n=1 Tax=Actinomadura madurae TaxID=1993 RepID=UPI0020D21E4E|nr:hypothetical protein [Actinomadura madurae]MCQ0008453.1 hypothetical protein [Actinomadura madurae]
MRTWTRSFGTAGSHARSTRTASCSPQNISPYGSGASMPRATRSSTKRSKVMVCACRICSCQSRISCQPRSRVAKTTCTSDGSSASTARRACCSVAPPSRVWEKTTVGPSQSRARRAIRSHAPSQLGSRWPPQLISRRSMTAAKCSCGPATG